LLCGPFRVLSRARGRDAAKAWRGRWSQALALAASLSPTLAFAHEGDHAAMGLAQVARHIATSPDHLAELAVAALFAVGGVIRARRRAAR
jgi:hypothetical protein